MMDGITGVRIPVTYMERWDDEFCARGWKLDCSIHENSVIASTADAGTRIPTSVLIHDILDHRLCGVDIGGHRNEAIALVQLAQRTGADPKIDYAQIVNEDIFIGHVNGESMMEFLPSELKKLVNPKVKNGMDIITILIKQVGRENLRNILVDYFFSIGKAEEKVALEVFESHGLSYKKRTRIGLCLQRILMEADSDMCNGEVKIANGEFFVSNNECALIISTPVKHTYTELVM